MTFVDELASGVAPASAPDLARDFALSPGFVAGAMITAFHALALLIEAPLLAWADRGRVRVVSSVALFALAAVCLLAALAPSAAWLFVALALYGPASGCALAASEGVLVESRPDAREQTMTRLSLAGTLGDLSVPAILALLAAVHSGWRVAMGIASAVSLVLAIVHARSRALDRPMASSHDDDDDDAESAAGPRPPLRELAHALRTNPALLGWSLAGNAINLLDEVLVAFAAVHLDAYTHASAAWRAASVGGWTVGGIIGLLALDRVLGRVAPTRILAVASATAVLALTAFAFTRSPLVAVAAFTAVGLSAATFHPLTKARAYAALPGRPALVNAVASVFLPLDALAPLGLAALAVTLGSRAAVLALLVAPVGIGLAALAARQRE